MHLRSKDYFVETVALSVAQGLVNEFHYSGGGANTATFRHGLFRTSDPETCLGVAWWIPPTKGAAISVYPEGEWKSVLCLSRLVIHPDVPTNGASFLLGKSIRLIRDDPRWHCLVTYADTWQGHTGAIYKATNWEPRGETAPEPTWIDPETGRMVSRKRGPKTFTRAQMEEKGYEMIGRFSKHRFRFVL